MKSSRLVTSIAVAALVASSLSGCMRARILETPDSAIVGIEQYVLARSEHTDAPSTQANQDLLPQTVVSEPQEQQVSENKTAGRSEGNADAQAEAPNSDIDKKDPQAESSAAQTSNPDSSAKSNKIEGPKDGDNTSRKKPRQGGEPTTDPGGSTIDQATIADGEGDGKKNSNEQTDSTKLIESKLLGYKNELTRAESLRCLAKSAYVELEGDYEVANRTTAIGQAVALPQIINVGFDKYDKASAMWVADKGENINIIVKAVPSSVLGKGVTSEEAAKQVVKNLKEREGWGAIDAVKNDAIVLVSSEFAATDVGSKMLSVYLGVMAYPDIYKTAELKNGDMAAMYRDITGTEIDGMYFFPKIPA